MRRFVGLLAVCAVVLGISLSHHASAQSTPPSGVTVCHITTSRTLANGNTVSLGSIVQVPLPALFGHLSHGDVVLIGGPTEGCCGFCVPANGVGTCPVNLD